MGLFLGFLSCFIYLCVCMSVFVPVPYHLDNFSFVMLSEVIACDSSSSVILSQDYFGTFVFPYKLKTFLF